MSRQVESYTREWYDWISVFEIDHSIIDDCFAAVIPGLVEGDKAVA